MKIKYHKQETCWTCGPAVIRMFLDTNGIRKTERQLVKMLRTTKQGGTKKSSIIRFAKEKGFTYITGNNFSISEIKKLMKRNFFVIVSVKRKTPENFPFRINKDFKIEENHFAVVRRITKSRIFILDPIYGPKEMFEFDDFNKIWHEIDHHEKDRGWFIAIKKEEEPEIITINGKKFKRID